VPLNDLFSTKVIKSLESLVDSDGNLVPSTYGEMYYNGVGDTITIVESDEYQAWTGPIVGLVNGLTFQAGIVGVIASTSTTAGSIVTINDSTHGLSVGDMITINGTTSYNGVYEVKTVPNVNSFTITETNSEGSETGNWQRGSSLTFNAGSGGVYAGRWAASMSAATANDIFELGPVVNTTISPKAGSTRKFSNTDVGSLSGTGMILANDGDKIFFVVRNTTAARNCTIIHFDINIQH